MNDAVLIEDAEQMAARYAAEAAARAKEGARERSDGAASDEDITRIVEARELGFFGYFYVKPHHKQVGALVAFPTGIFGALQGGFCLFVVCRLHFCCFLSWSCMGNKFFVLSLGT